MIMKICFAINNLQAGGAERVFSSIVNWFAENTVHRIYALQFSYPCTISDFYHLDCRVEEHYSFFKDIDSAASILSKIKPDCVISFLNPMNYVISIASQRVGIPHIACERNDPYFSPPKNEDRIMRDEAFCNASGCIFQTPNASSYYDKKFLKGRIKIIGNPVCVTESWEGNKDNRIVTVGRYAEQKNYPTLLHAFNLFQTRHPEYKLDCYGKDSGKLNYIKNFAREKNWDIGVSFNTPIENIHEEIRSAKLFIMSSLYEGMPNALMEAGALGIPIVASNVPGVRDLVSKYHCGVLCPPNDSEAFASNMESLLADKSLYALLASNGKKIIEEVGINKIAPLWLSYIEEIVLSNTFYVI